MTQILIGPSLYHSHKPPESQRIDDSGGANAKAVDVPN